MLEPLTKTMVDDPKQISVWRLRRLMMLHNLNGRALAKKSQVDIKTVYGILNEKHTPRLSIATRLAETLGCSLQDLMRQNGDQELPVKKGLEIPVTGIAETGAYRVHSDSALDPIIGPQFPRFGNARHFAWQVRDASMNIAKPHLHTGAYALFVSLSDTNQGVSDGKIYAVRRQQPGGLPASEFLIRRAQVYLDRVELHADSDDPEKFPMIRLDVLDCDPTKLVYAEGLLYCVMTMLL